MNECQSRGKTFQAKRTAAGRRRGVRVQSRWLNGEQVGVAAAPSSAGALFEDA